MSRKQQPTKHVHPTVTANQPPLPSKDQSNFRSALKLYEDKQYKKALKHTQHILKSFPKHADTIALKSLILSYMDRKDESVEGFKEALAIDTESFLVWQLYGIFLRVQKQYPEATKAFAKASQLDPLNLNILRELGSLYMQVKQFPDLVKVRAKILESANGYRAHWTSVAVAHYYNKNLKAAENILTSFEDTYGKRINQNEPENSEVALFKNTIIYEQGDVERALQHLKTIESFVNDKLEILRRNAKYLLELKRYKEAEKLYRALIKRNPDCREFYKPLEICLGITPEKVELRIMLYKRLSEKYPRSDVAKTILLDLLSGEAFGSYVTTYMKNSLIRGVPALFVLLKPFYGNTEKRNMIEKAALQLQEEFASDDDKKKAKVWADYFLAQHYNYLRNIDNALDLIKKCIDAEPNTQEFKLAHARILKHAGDFAGAADVLEKAREAELSDRYMNSKATKYLLRANNYEQAIEIASKFTRNDHTNTGIKDMHEMENLWILIEQAEALYRMGHYALSLKRFTAIFKVFDEYYTDQFDFHAYSPRMGTVRAYIDAIDFEDRVYSHPTYIRALKGASKIYFKIEDELKQIKYKAAQAESIENESEKADALAKIAAEKKQREEELEKELKTLQESWERIKEYCTEDAKTRPTKESAAAKNNNQQKEAKPEEDQFGFEQYATQTPIEDLNAYWKLLSEQGPNKLATWELGFEILLREQKLILALQTISTKIKNIDNVPESWIISRAIRLYNAIKAPAPSDAPLPAPVKMVVERSLGNICPEVKESKDLLALLNEKVLQDGLQSQIGEWVEALKSFQFDTAKFNQLVEEQIFNGLKNSHGKEWHDIKYFITNLDILESIKSSRVKEYRSEAKKAWPLATIF